jgi:hypothetical protein
VQFRGAQISAEQFRAAQISFAQVRAFEPGFRKIAISQIRLAHVRAAQIGVAEFRSAQVGFPQVASREVRSGQIALLQIRAGKIGAGKIGAFPARMPLMEFLVRVQNVFQLLAFVSNGLRLPRLFYCLTTVRVVLSSFCNCYGWLCYSTGNRVMIKSNAMSCQ